MSKLHRDNAGYVGCSYEETQDPYYSYNKLALPLSESDKTVIRDEVTFTVTVASASGGNKYFIDGTQQATVSLLEGNVYTFDQSHSSNGTHPLKFSYTADGTWGGGLEYTLGVTTNGTPGQSGAYTRIVVPFGLHDLKYYCGNHSGMGGSANVVKNTKAFTVGRPILKTTDAFGKTLGSGNNADPYAANLVLAVPMAGGNFNDIHANIKGSGSNKNVDISGVTSVSTSRLYGSAGEFVGATDHLQFYGAARDNTPDFAFAANEDFTVEAWIWWDSDNQTGNTGSIVADYYENSVNSSPNWQFVRRNGGEIAIWWNNNGTTVSIGTPAGAMSDKNWHHVVVQRKGSTFEFIVDGDTKSSHTASGYSNAIGRGRSLWVGIDANEVDEDFCGYIQDLRVYKGIAKYTTPFPTGKYGMDVVNYPGNSSNRSFTLNHRPDLVWIKAKDHGFHHQLFDSVRGVNLRLRSSHDAGQATAANSLTAFNSNGFSLGTDSNGDVNGGSGSTQYVAWTWRAGGQPTADNSAGIGQTPTSGSVMIDGTASSSAQAGTHNFKRISASNIYGFSIVKFEGTDNGVYPTGLQTTPDFIIYKDIDASQWWRVYHSGMTSGLSGGKTLYLNQDYDESTDNDRVTAVSSNTFTVGNVVDNDNYIAYIWSEREGFSKFGTFSHDGSSGQTLDFGFKPRWWLVKEKDGNTNWYIFDATRDNFDDPFFAETTGNASSGWGFTFSGTTVTWVGGSFAAGNYIYAVFAESAAGEEFESHLVGQLDLSDRSGGSNNASNKGATWQSSVKKFYDGAAYFDGLSVLDVEASSDYAFGSEDFSIEFWVKTGNKLNDGTYRRMFVLDGPTGDTGTNFSINIDANGGHVIAWGGNAGPGNIVSQGVDITDDQWHHIAVVREATTVTTFVDGSPQGSGTDTRSLFAGSTPAPRVGGFATSSGRVNGYMQDVRVYKGIAKYTSSFSPPERSVQGTARRYPSGVYVVS